MLLRQGQASINNNDITSTPITHIIGVLILQYMGTSDARCIRNKRD